MTALEATGTDPQQRLMLEVAYEALENGEEISMKNSSYMGSMVHSQLVFRSMILSVPKRVYTLGASRMILKAWEVEILVSALPTFARG